MLRRNDHLIQGDERTAASWPAGYVHLPRGVDAEWVKQLVGEQLVTVKTQARLHPPGMAEIEGAQRGARLPGVCSGGRLDRGTAVARARLVDGGGPARLENVQVIFRQQPKVTGPNHWGSRLVFVPDGTLFVTLGERFQRDRAQNFDADLGKRDGGGRCGRFLHGVAPLSWIQHLEPTGSR